MSYELYMGQDDILRLVYTGPIEEGELDVFVAEYEVFLGERTAESPLLMLSEATRAGKLSPEARKVFADLGQDPRLAKNAIVGVGRYARVIAGFINKAAGRDNIRFFETEEEALAWLLDCR